MYIFGLFSFFRFFAFFISYFFFFFFFQAEDGIRDGTVTGVQTCALPISPQASHVGWSPKNIDMSRIEPGASSRRQSDRLVLANVPSSRSAKMPFERSEEHTSELQSQFQLVCRLLLEKNNRVIL